MNWITRKPKKSATSEHESRVDIVKSKQKETNAAKQATDQIKKLNNLLEANGIKVFYIAAGGQRGH